MAVQTASGRCIYRIFLSVIAKRYFSVHRTFLLNKLAQLFIFRCASRRKLIHPVFRQKIISGRKNHVEIFLAFTDFVHDSIVQINRIRIPAVHQRRQRPFAGKRCPGKVKFIPRRLSQIDFRLVSVFVDINVSFIYAIFYRLFPVYIGKKHSSIRSNGAAGNFNRFNARLTGKSRKLFFFPAIPIVSGNQKTSFIRI